MVGVDAWAAPHRCSEILLPPPCKQVDLSQISPRLKNDPYLPPCYPSQLLTGTPPFLQKRGNTKVRDVLIMQSIFQAATSVHILSSVNNAKELFHGWILLNPVKTGN